MLNLRRHVQKRRYVMLTYMIHEMSSRASSKIFNCLHTWHMTHDTDGWKEIGKLQATKILRLPIMENSSLWNKTSSCRWTIGRWQTLYNDINRFTECEPLVRKLLSGLSCYAPVVQLQGKKWPRLQNLLLDAPTGLLFSFLSKKENCSESWAVLYNCWGKLLRTKNCFYNTSATDCC